MAATGSLLIGDRAFWRPGVSPRQREILGFLVERGPVDVVYAGAEVGEFHRLAVQLAAAAITREIRCEALPPSLDPRRAAARLAALVAERAPGRVVAFSPEFAWVADLLPAAVPLILDAAGPPADAGAEARLIEAARGFDRVLFDDLRRHRAAVAVLGAGRCGWAPQPVATADPLPPLRGAATRVGVSFGADAVDIDALAWLHDAVWRRPELAAARGAVEVVVGGDPGDGRAARACPDFRFVGPVDRSLPFFAAVDIVAAPAEAAGQPPVEAFGFARPLVATSAAIAGLFEVAAPACTVADGAEAFAAALALLIGDAAARRRFVDAGLDLARRVFVPEACFRALVEAAPGARPPTAVAAAGRDPGASPAAVLALAQAHRRAGRSAQAEAEFRGLLARDPDHAEALLGLGVLLARTGNPVAALPYLRRAAECAPGDPQAWSSLAAALNALARHAEAEAAADRALALQSNSIAALAARARARRGLGRAAEAEADCTAVLARRAVPELLHERGLARWAQGLPGAEADLRAAVAACPAEAAWAADLARLIHRRHADEAPQPRVAIACPEGLSASWEPVWALPGVAAAAVDPGAEPPADSDLVVTTDAALARRLAADRRLVWLCGEGGGDSPYLKAFPDRGGRGWAIAEISAHLAVWARAWRATNATTKPIAAEEPEGYIPR